MLYIFGGLPGTGKTELSRFLANHIGAAYLRIDSIEQQLRNAGFTDLYDQGYKVAFALAAENLKNGMSVVADSTNPVLAARQGWRAAARQAKSDYREIEIICSDQVEHRYRIDNRVSDIAELVLPDWHSVISREYHPWSTADVVVDTAGRTPTQSKKELVNLLSELDQTNKI